MSQSSILILLSLLGLLALDLSAMDGGQGSRLSVNLFDIDPRKVDDDLAKLMKQVLPQKKAQEKAKISPWFVVKDDGHEITIENRSEFKSIVSFPDEPIHNFIAGRISMEYIFFPHDKLSLALRPKTVRIEVYRGGDWRILSEFTIIDEIGRVYHVGNGGIYQITDIDMQR